MKGKEKIIIAVITFCIAIGGIVYLLGKKDINKEISTIISIQNISETENEIKISTNLGVIPRDKIDELKGLSDKKIIIYSFEGEESFIIEDKEYDEKLSQKIVIDNNKVEEFLYKVLPNINEEKLVKFDDIKEEDLVFDDSKLIITLNADITDSEKENLAFAKSFVSVFRNINKDKEISSIKLIVNNDEESGFIYISDYKDLYIEKSLY